MSAEQAAVMASEQAAGMARDNTDATMVQLTVTGCGTADNRTDTNLPPEPVRRSSPLASYCAGAGTVPFPSLIPSRNTEKGSWRRSLSLSP